MKRTHVVIVCVALSAVVVFFGSRSYYGYRYKLESTAATKLLLDLYAYLSEYRTSHAGQWPSSIETWQMGVRSNAAGVFSRLAYDIDYHMPMNAQNTNVLAAITIYTRELITVSQEGTVLRHRK